MIEQKQDRCVFFEVRRPHWKTPTARRAKMVSVCATALALTGMATTALATQDGQTHYPPGVNTVANGYVPLPGTLQLLDYTVGHWSHTLANDSGNESVPGFSNSGAVNAMRFMYTFAKPIGPFHYTLGGILTAAYNHVDVGAESDHAINLGDLDIENYLAYHTPDEKMFMFFGLDTYLPTGRYNKHHLVNPGRNYWSFDPNINLTYHVNDKLALNSSVYLEFNTKNTAIDYQSGDTVDIDYAANYRPFVHQSTDTLAQHLGFGIQGYYLKQFTNDTVHGDRVGPDGHRAQGFAIGPQIVYYTRFGGFALKYQHDLAVENRAASDAAWFEFSMPLLGSFRQFENK